MPRTLDCQILVIGGGSTGAGVAWDAALRGFQVILADRGDLATGTTGRYHGLLHSGGRYVVRDPDSARECARENAILREVASDCIEDTGGLFVSTPVDDPEYAERFLAGCQQTGVAVEEIRPQAALRREPRLNPAIRRAFAVADASVDGWKLVWACTRAAQELGARVLTYHPVTGLVRDVDRVVGARLRDLRSGEELEVRAQCVVNAAGAWSGQVARLAGCEVAVRPGKGVMVAMNHRLVNTVVNRCNPPGDGDILVPIRTVSVIGTTDTPVEDPDDAEVDPAEVARLLDAGEVLVPGFHEARALRVWTGVRPLFPKAAAGEGGDRFVTRSHTVIRHARSEGVAGLVSVAGGKVTTFRLMAKDTVDAAAAELADERPCRTATTPLPDSAARRFYWLGSRAQEFERAGAENPIVCECELVSTADLLAAASRRPQPHIDDLRRAMRIGMGPCQGGFCAFRAAATLHREGAYDRRQANSALREFVEERWRGQRPVLWGQQLRQAELDRWLFEGVLDIEHVPG
ncbi:MAG TPA: anaerobic glycerol-3-phosphate dehydrogenase subunit GlpA [Candidatus Binatia bacterium]|nr:anaerobic glycerol-3-phosphate dehydrogenase subunit GlpA [Candidatus Binatia bacterium]